VAQHADPLSNDVFVYLGSILKAANGSFDESFELNQLSPGTPSSPTYRTINVAGTQVAVPARKTGDVLLTFDSSGGVVTIGLCKWRSSQPDPAPGDPYPAGYFDSGRWYLLNGTAVDDTNDKACTRLNTTTSPTAEGAINPSAIAAADNPLSGVDVSAGNFGELSVDISKALTTNPCFNFKSVWMRTRSSNQVNSNPEDVVLPKPIDASNCPGAVTPLTSSTGTNTPSPSTTGNLPPVLGPVSLDHRTWRLGSVGMTISFRLSEPGRTTLAFSQARAGRRLNGRCVAPTRRNRHRRACTRKVRIGSLSIDAHTGLNRVLFRGKLSNHKTLRPGRYTLTITTVDRTGMRSAPRTASFKVLPRR
jgi:hypothetical protein